MNGLTFFQYKTEIVNTITNNMFNDKQHYSYYSELLVNVLLSREFSKFKISCPDFKQMGFIKKDKEHLEVLKREFSEVVQLIEGEKRN